MLSATPLRLRRRAAGHSSSIRAVIPEPVIVFTLPAEPAAICWSAGLIICSIGATAGTAALVASLVFEYRRCKINTSPAVRQAGASSFYGRPCRRPVRAHRGERGVRSRTCAPASLVTLEGTLPISLAISRQPLPLLASSRLSTSRALLALRRTSSAVSSVPSYRRSSASRAGRSGPPGAT